MVDWKNLLVVLLRSSRFPPVVHTVSSVSISTILPHSKTSKPAIASTTTYSSVPLKGSPTGSRTTAQTVAPTLLRTAVRAALIALYTSEPGCGIGPKVKVGRSRRVTGGSLPRRPSPRVTDVESTREASQSPLVHVGRSMNFPGSTHPRAIPVAHSVVHNSRRDLNHGRSKLPPNERIGDVDDYLG